MYLHRQISRPTQTYVSQRKQGAPPHARPRPPGGPGGPQVPSNPPSNFLAGLWAPAAPYRPPCLKSAGFALVDRAAARCFSLAGWLAGCQPSRPASHPEALRLAQIPFSPSWSSSFDPRLPKIRIPNLEYDDHVVRTAATPSRCQPFWPKHDVTSLLAYSYMSPNDPHSKTSSPTFRKRQLKTVQGVRIRICRPTDLYSQIQTNISFLGFAQSFEWR